MVVYFKNEDGVNLAYLPVPHLQVNGKMKVVLCIFYLAGVAGKGCILPALHQLLPGNAYIFVFNDLATGAGVQVCGKAFKGFNPLAAPQYCHNFLQINFNHDAKVE
ncbi:MAG: hypothetical protein AAB874_06325 [Patescibacteria group bacterium]